MSVRLNKIIGVKVLFKLQRILQMGDLIFEGSMWPEYRGL